MTLVFDAIAAILLIGGAILLAVEFAHPGALLFIPASILLAAGLLYVFLPESLLSEPWGALVILVAAVGAAVLQLPYYRYIGKTHRPMTTTSAGLEGAEGVVIAPVIPDSLRGKIRVQSEVWSARSTKSIPAGVRVRVVGGEGVSVWVVPIEELRADGTGAA